MEHLDEGNKALSRLREGQFDVAIIDLMVPGMDGLSLIRTLRAKKYFIPILVLSAKRGVDQRIEGLRTGADDFLTKPFSFTELLVRLQSLVRRAQGFVQATELAVGGLRLDIISRRAWSGELLLDLQPKEFDLLRYLMENAENSVSKTALIDQIWNFNFNTHTNIVEAKICKLREKIDKGQPGASIHTVRGVGYVLRKDS